MSARKHIEPEELLAYSDGELNLGRRIQVRLHLFTCWRCRARYMETADAVRQAIDLFQRGGAAATPLAGQHEREWLSVMNATPRFSSMQRRKHGWARVLPWAAPAVAVGAALTIPTLWGPKPAARTEAVERKPVNGTRPAIPLAGATSIPAPRGGSDEFRLPAPPALEAPLVPQIDWNAIEMRVEFVLHTLEVCRGEAVRIRRSPTRLELEGYVSSAERRQEIQNALDAAALSAQVHVGLALSSELAPDPAAVAIDSSAGGVKAEAPVAAWLQEHFKKQGVAPAQRIAEESTQWIATAFSHAQNAQIEMSALVQLADRWTPTQSAGLDAMSKRLLHSMAQAHAAEMLEEVEALRRLMSAVFPQAAATPLSGMRRETWQSAVKQLSTELAGAQRIVGALLTGDAMPADFSVETSGASLRTRLDALRSALTSLQHELQSQALPEAHSLQTPQRND